MAGEKPIAVYGAAAANGIIAITKFVAAGFTGSSAMAAEGIHSVVDTGNQLLILFGIKRSKTPADERHPFGYGKELYFWSLIVAMLLFGIGGGMSMYEGIRHFRHPSELGDPTWNYWVLGIALVVESVAWWLALKELLKSQGERSLWQALRESKDPAVFIVLGEDTAAMLGLIVAFFGVYLGHRFDNPAFDGIASIIIGFILAAVAVFLAYESKGLLIGESADLKVVRGIQEIGMQDEAVAEVAPPLTMYLAPREVLLTLEVDFKNNLSAEEVEQAIDRLEKRIREQYPQVKRIFIEAESLKRKSDPDNISTSAEV